MTARCYQHPCHVHTVDLQSIFGPVHRVPRRGDHRRDTHRPEAHARASSTPWHTASSWQGGAHVPPSTWTWHTVPSRRQSPSTRQSIQTDHGSTDCVGTALEAAAAGRARCPCAQPSTSSSSGSRQRVMGARVAQKRQKKGGCLRWSGGTSQRKYPPERRCTAPHASWGGVPVTRRCASSSMSTERARDHVTQFQQVTQKQHGFERPSF